VLAEQQPLYGAETTPPATHPTRRNTVSGEERGVLTITDFSEEPDPRDA
jgi:hypothetical protein